MEATQEVVTTGNVIIQGVPNWLVLMLIGAVIALILIGAIKRSGVPFFGIIIVILVIVFVAANSESIHLSEWMDKLLGESEANTETLNPDDETDVETQAEKNPIAIFFDSLFENN